MTQKGLNKRKDYRLKKRGKVLPRKVKGFNLRKLLKNNLTTKERIELDSRVKKSINIGIREYKISQQLKRLRKNYTYFVKPKTSEGWRTWYTRFKLRVSYL